MVEVVVVVLSVRVLRMTKSRSWIGSMRMGGEGRKEGRGETGWVDS